jgi:hypothetical protein
MTVIKQIRAGNAGFVDEKYQYRKQEPKKVRSIFYGQHSNLYAGEMGYFP